MGCWLQYKLKRANVRKYLLIKASTKWLYGRQLGMVLIRGWHWPVGDTLSKKLCKKATSKTGVVALVSISQALFFW